LDLSSAVRVIRFRSLHQESTRGQGGMTVVAASLGVVEALLGEPGLDGNAVVVSGENGPASVTVAGPIPDLEALERMLASRSIQFKRLDLDYPFHSPAMDALLMRFRGDLGNLHQGTPLIPIFSTVTGEEIENRLPAEYWAENIREPVRFRQAVESACREGHRVYLEIGPHPVLRTHVQAVLRDKKNAGFAAGVVFREAAGVADLEASVLRIKAGGSPNDWEDFFPLPPSGFIELPHYPWQREEYLLPVSPEGGGMLMRFKEHPLLGYRLREATWTWENHLDVARGPQGQRLCGLSRSGVFGIRARRGRFAPRPRVGACGGPRNPLPAGAAGEALENDSLPTRGGERAFHDPESRPDVRGCMATPCGGPHRLTRLQTPAPSNRMPRGHRQLG
jgi:acyl transferase domain-containing protein